MGLDVTSSKVAARKFGNISFTVPFFHEERKDLKVFLLFLAAKCSSKNHQGSLHVCLSGCLYGFFSLFTSCSQDVQATHTSKCVTLCNIFCGCHFSFFKKEINVLVGTALFGHQVQNKLLFSFNYFYCTILTFFASKI